MGYCAETGCTQGLLWGPFAETLGDYQGMSIAYSGYNGVNFQLGNEYITISGKTTVPILMEAYAYKAGTASVAYSWTRTVSACCLGTAPCGGSFSETLGLNEIVTLGNIPAGVKSLEITLTTSGADVDIQLYDADDGMVTRTRLLAPPFAL